MKEIGVGFSTGLSDIHAIGGNLPSQAATILWTFMFACGAAPTAPATVGAAPMQSAFAASPPPPPAATSDTEEEAGTPEGPRPADVSGRASSAGSAGARGGRGGSLRGALQSLRRLRSGDGGRSQASPTS